MPITQGSLKTEDPSFGGRRLAEAHQNEVTRIAMNIHVNELMNLSQYTQTLLKEDKMSNATINAAPSANEPEENRNRTNANFFEKEDDMSERTNSTSRYRDDYEDDNSLGSLFAGVVFAAAAYGVYKLIQQESAPRPALPEPSESELVRYFMSRENRS